MSVYERRHNLQSSNSTNGGESVYERRLKEGKIKLIEDTKKVSSKKPTLMLNKSLVEQIPNIKIDPMKQSINKPKFNNAIDTDIFRNTKVDSKQLINRINTEKNIKTIENLQPKVNTGFLEKDDTFSKVVGVTGGIATGVSNAGSYGLREKGLQRGPQYMRDIEETIKDKHPIAYWIGERIGENVNPVGIALNSIPISKGLSLGKTMLMGGGLNSGQGAIEEGVRSLVRGDDKKDVLKNTASGAVGGFIGGAVFSGLGKGLQKLNQPIIKPTSDIGNEFIGLKKTTPNEIVNLKELPSGGKLALPEPAIQQPPIPLRPKTLNVSKATRNVDNILKEYDNAVEIIQGHFKTNQLRADEIARIKPELGIDIDDITNRLLKAETTTSREILEKTKAISELKKMYKLEDPKVSKVLNNLKTELSANNNLIKTQQSKPINLEVNPQFKKETPFTVFKGSENITEKPIPSALKNINKTIDEFTPTIHKSNNPLDNIEKPIINQPKAPNERGFSANVRTDTNMNDKVRIMFEEDPLMYQKISNKETLSKAQHIFNKGFDIALEDWHKNIDNFRPEDVPLARMLSNEAIQKGNTELARRIISDTAEKLTKAGQYSQSARILRESDPETFSIFIQRQINKLNNEGQEIYKKKWTDIKLTDDELKTITKMGNMTPDSKDEFMGSIYNRLAKELPSSGVEKFNAWRRVAMLLNPTTHIRNIGGNILMGGMQKTSDAIGTALEGVAKKLGYMEDGQLTKSVFWRSNKEIVNTVDEYWDIAKKDLFDEGRWDFSNLKVMGHKKDIFKNKLLNALDKFSGDTLNAEDDWFVKKSYKDALGQYLDANKLKEVTLQAHEYAKDRAMEATFKQVNEIASFVNKMKRKKGGVLVEAAIPFTTTPANLVKSSFDYSPAGFTKLLFSKGEAPSKTIETISKGLTGSAIATTGFLLAKSGWARSEKQSSKKAETMLSQFGEQPYSIITPKGSYTFDWAQPFAVPFAMGMVLYENLEKKGKLDLDSVADVLTESGDTIFNLSMLSNIKDLFGGGFGSPTEKIAGLPVSYLEQAFPTVVGKVARSVDSTRRNTYDPNGIKKFTNELKAKTPFLSKTLEPKLDTFGREQKHSSAIEQLLSPGFLKKKSDDPVEKEMMRLYKNNKETSMLPKISPTKLTDKGKQYILLPKELTEFQRKMGQSTHKELNNLVNTPIYEQMTEEEKAKKIQKIIESNYDKCKKEYLKSKGVK